MSGLGTCKGEVNRLGGVDGLTELGDSGRTSGGSITGWRGWLGVAEGGIEGFRGSTKGLDGSVACLLSVS